MTQTTLNTTARTATGGSYRRSLAAKGLVPAIVYGKNTGSLPIEVDARSFCNVMAGGRNTIIDLAVEGGMTHKVMVKEIQRDPIRQDIIHIDFHQISLVDTMQAAVTLVFEGEISAGGIMQIVKRELSVSCLPEAIPESIKVDVSGLNPGDAITVGQLAVPEKVTFLDEPEQPVVTVTTQAAEEPAEAGDEAKADGEVTGTKE